MTSNDIQIRLAENLKRIRKSQKLTQFQLAEKAGISDETVKNIELCKTWISEKTLAQITDVLNIDVSMLFLPVSSSFEKDSEASTRIKNVIGENIVKYVNTVLEEVYSNK